MIQTASYVDEIQKHAVRFHDPSDLQPLVEAASHAKFVLLGEASHGTSEFYTVRAAMTKQLIEKHGFSFIAVEGDWPSCYELNRYVKGRAPEYKHAKDALQAFNRWPTWMWANEEIAALADWLYTYNQKQTDEHEKVGFYGMDVYSLWESMEAMIQYLESLQSPDIEKVKEAFACFEPYHRKAEMYGVSAALYGENCMEEVTQLLRTIQQNKHTYHSDSEASLNMQINALVTANAEAYYHAMVTHDDKSWNIRDQHMVEALDYISKYYGKEAKGIVWEHNTHIGDARATDMARQGLVNVGQLTREKYGQEHIYSIGFGTHHGTVIAAKSWGDPLETMIVPAATRGSWEDALHEAGAFNKYILFTKENYDAFRSTIGHRAIGVVYHPEYEHLGNYVPSRLSDRYNAFIHIEETKAVSPLALQTQIVM